MKKILIIIGLLISLVGYGQTVVNSRVMLDSLSNKAGTSGTVTLPATTSIGGVSSTEIGYVNGATSNIQTQLNDTVSISVGVPFIKLTPSASPPSGASEGMIYMDTDHHLYVYNNSSWVVVDN